MTVISKGINLVIKLPDVCSVRGCIDVVDIEDHNIYENKKLWKKYKLCRKHHLMIHAAMEGEFVPLPISDLKKLLGKELWRIVSDEMKRTEKVVFT